MLAKYCTFEGANDIVGRKVKVDGQRGAAVDDTFTDTLNQEGVLWIESTIEIISKYAINQSKTLEQAKLTAMQTGNEMEVEMDQELG